MCIRTSAEGLELPLAFVSPGAQIGPNGDVLTISLKKTPTLEVYDFSGQIKQYASPVYFRRIGPRTPPVALNLGMWASETPPVGDATALGVFGAGAFGNHTYRGATIYRVGAETISARMRIPLSWSVEQGSVLLAVGDNIFLQGIPSPPGLGAITEVDTKTGRIVHSYAVRGIPYTSTHGLFVGNTSAGWIESLVVDRGHLYAFQFDSQAAAIDDLSDGTRHLLPGYSSLGGGVVGADGALYVMAWSEKSRPTFDILRIDPFNLSIISTTHTGIRATSVDNAQMQALPGGSIIAFVAQQRENQVNPMTNYLWKLSGSHLERTNLPANSGLDMRAFADGIYVFGGPGRNVVTRVSLSNLSLMRTAPSLTTPAGTWIFALT